jgi:hypothetical protein
MPVNEDGAGLVLLLFVLLVMQRSNKRRTQALKRRTQALELAAFRQRQEMHKRRHPGPLGSPEGRPWKLPRMSGVEAESVLLFNLRNPHPTRRFIQNFRVDIGMFNFLHDALKDDLAVHPNNFRPDPVHPDEAIAMALYALGTPADFRTIGNVASRGETTISKHLYRVCNAIVKKWGQQSANPVIKHASAAGNVRIAQRFLEERGMPGCIGALDGKHWSVKVGEFSSFVLCERTHI